MIGLNKILYLYLLYTKCLIQLFFEHILKKEIIACTCYY